MRRWRQTGPVNEWPLKRARRAARASTPKGSLLLYNVETANKKLFFNFCCDELMKRTPIKNARVVKSASEGGLKWHLLRGWGWIFNVTSVVIRCFQDFVIFNEQSSACEVRNWLFSEKRHSLNLDKHFLIKCI